MNYEDMTAEEFKTEFKILREKIISKTYGIGSIKADRILAEEYTKLCEMAAEGNPVACDLLAEWFRNGNSIVPENIEISMKWLFLAGAEGNKFSLDRLKIHFGYAFDTIIEENDFGDFSLKFNITSDNYQYVIGQLLCKAIVEDLDINALDLSKEKLFYLPFSSIILRGFDRSIQRAVETVLKYFRS